MRALAEYAMRGRREATLVAVLSAAVPLLFWLSAATVVLITLRKGWSEGLNLLLWAALPALAWLVLGSDPTPLLVIVGSMISAVVLRATVSWVYTLLTSTLLALLISALVPVLMPELMAEFMQGSREVLAKMAPETTAQGGEQLEQLLRNLLAGILGAAHLLAMVLSLILGRWWQSALYNPGGFGEEFRQLLLPAKVAVPGLLVALFGANLHPALVALAPLLTVPLFIAGIALVHGVINLRQMSTQWLVAFYLLVFFVGPYFYLLLVVLAVVDSLVNFRRRIRTTPE